MARVPCWRDFPLEDEKECIGKDCPLNKDYYWASCQWGRESIWYDSWKKYAPLRENNR